MTATIETAPYPKIPVGGPCQDGCLTCTTGRHAPQAYRPHALDLTCWCCFGDDGERTRSKCVMAYWVQEHTPRM